jgi:DNA-binding Lrp family transcriptional regulator
VFDTKAQFNAYHVWKTLSLAKKGIIGRKKLAEELELGEGSVRTLIRYLRDLGLVETFRLGIRPTKEGKRFLSSLGILPLPVIDGLKVAEYAYSMKITPVRSLGKGFEQRDAAVRAGGVGATTLVCKNGKLCFAGENEDAEKIYKELSKLRKKYFSEGDVLIVGSATTKKKAEEATFLAALTLLDFTLNRIKEIEPYCSLSILLECPIIIRTNEGMFAYLDGKKIEVESDVVERSWKNTHPIEDIEKKGLFAGRRIKTIKLKIDGKNAVIAVVK